MKKTFTFVFIIFSIFAFAQVPGAVPTNGLIAYWPFNGNANDVSGNAKNGTVTGATLTNDRFGSANSAYNFSGAAQFITCPSISELNGSNSASFSLWVKINGNNSWLNNNLGSAQYLLSRDEDFSSTNIGINYGPGNKLFGGRIGRNGSETGVGSTNTYNIPQSTWHHIVFTIGGGFLKLYVNGVFNSSSVYNGVMPSSSGNLFFGKLPVGGFEYYLNGFLDDIGIWNRALTATEITNLYNNTTVSIATPPVAASTQTFCGSATVADLAATGTNLKWYDVATGGASLASSAVLLTGTYYVSQTTGTNESSRTAVAVAIIPTTAPTAMASQTFCTSPTPTAANLTATGTAIKWYAAATGGTALANTTALITGTTYYASQTVGTCESTRTTVAVSINDPQITASATTVCAGTAVILTASTTLSGTGTSVLPSNLQTGLVGYWPFNGNANDTSGNGNNGTINGATLTTDRFGNANNAYSFNGSTNYIEVAGTANTVSYSNGLTISLWVKVTEPSSSSAQFLVAKANDQLSGHFHLAYHTNVGKFQGDFNGIGNDLYSPSSYPTPFTSWYHAAFIYDNSNLKLYVNGTLSGTYNYINQIAFSNSNIFIGTSGMGLYYTKGLIDDVAIYNRALSLSEIQQLNNSSSFLWSTGETTATINQTPTTTTTYWCDVTVNGATCRKEITITVNSNSTIPTFTQVESICSGVILAALPTTSTNGIIGTWSPALNNNVTTTYTFTPTVGQCAIATTMIITVNPNSIPSFTQMESICSGATIAALPTTSTNGVTGMWSPLLNNTSTTTYTFTPDAGQCATTTTQTITINTTKVTSPISFLAPPVTATPLPNVTIGTQIWSNKNLDVATYRDGTPIPQVTDPTQWANLTTGAWCYYNNDPANGTIYGKLYNWYAVEGIHDSDPNTPNKILAPQGWHVPSDAEWTTLTDFLGGGQVAGGKMKSTGTSLWLSPNTAATNESGFSGLPGGYRNEEGRSFYAIGFFGLWWSSSEEGNTTSAWFRSLSYGDGNAARSSDSKWSGFSVRCVKD